MNQGWECLVNEALWLIQFFVSAVERHWPWTVALEIFKYLCCLRLMAGSEDGLKEAWGPSRRLWWILNHHVSQRWGESRGELRLPLHCYLVCVVRNSAGKIGLTRRQRLLEVGGWQQGQWAKAAYTWCLQSSIHPCWFVNTEDKRISDFTHGTSRSHREEEEFVCKPETRKAWHWCPGGHRNFEPPFPDLGRFLFPYCKGVNRLWDMVSCLHSASCKLKSNFLDEDLNFKSSTMCVPHCVLLLKYTHSVDIISYISKRVLWARYYCFM